MSMMMLQASGIYFKPYTPNPEPTQPRTPNTLAVPVYNPNTENFIPYNPKPETSNTEL